MGSAKTHEPPKLNERYACIVDRDATALAALISSYLFIPGTYLPLFLLRRVHVVQSCEELGFMSEAYVAELMAGQDSVFIGKALGSRPRCAATPRDRAAAERSCGGGTT